jgi:endonuclease
MDAMPQLYDKPVWQLMRDMVADLGMEGSRTVTRSQIHAWFAEHYPGVKKATVSAHLLLLSTNAPSRIHYGVRPGDH